MEQSDIHKLFVEALTIALNTLQDEKVIRNDIEKEKVFSILQRAEHEDINNSQRKISDANFSCLVCLDAFKEGKRERVSKATPTSMYCGTHLKGNICMSVKEHLEARGLYEGKNIECLNLKKLRLFSEDKARLCSIVCKNTIYLVNNGSLKGDDYYVIIPMNRTVGVLGTCTVDLGNKDIRFHLTNRFENRVVEFAKDYRFVTTNDPRRKRSAMEEQLINTLKGQKDKYISDISILNK